MTVAMTVALARAGYAARVMRLAAATLLALTATAAGQAPANYYSTVVTANAAQLRATLHAVIDDHQRFPYTSGGTDTWDILEDADQDPGNASRILDVYRNASYAKVGGGNSNYNREHVWPNSYGFPNDGGSNYPYTDCHNLFLCNIGYNGQRDRKPFDNGSASWVEMTTVGGGSGSYPGNSNWRTTSNSPGGFEVWQDRRGDIARALFYMDVRYEGGTHQNGSAEPDLILTDTVSLITNSATGNNTSVAYMGKLSVLLQWHAQDPVDGKEMARNDAVFGYQGNRNPFVDHPEWVDCIFANQCSTSTSQREPEVWINELHYDNAGADLNEFVELAGRAGERIDGWMLVAYDGATGQAYDRVALRGTFADQQNGFGTLSFDFPGLQNGLDGVAVVTSTGVVMQFLSYGGTFVASNGACKGRSSVDIGVTEGASTPVGFSLRLSGTGSGYAQFAWQPPFVQTPGTPNVSQTFQ
jgi:endonuclease I